MTGAIQQHLSVTVVKDAHEAMRHGFFYREPVYKAVSVTQVVVVQNGTKSGKPTVDFVLEDATGQKFVFMLTGALLKSVLSEA